MTIILKWKQVSEQIDNEVEFYANCMMERTILFLVDCVAIFVVLRDLFLVFATGSRTF
jgi:hypothetical protein